MLINHTKYPNIDKERFFYNFEFSPYFVDNTKLEGLGSWNKINISINILFERIQNDMENKNCLAFLESLMEYFINHKKGVHFFFSENKILMNIEESVYKEIFRKLAINSREDPRDTFSSVKTDFWVLPRDQSFFLFNPFQTYAIKKNKSDPLYMGRVKGCDGIFPFDSVNILLKYPMSPCLKYDFYSKQIDSCDVLARNNIERRKLYEQALISLKKEQCKDPLIIEKDNDLKRKIDACNKAVAVYYENVIEMKKRIVLLKPLLEDYQSRQKGFVYRLRKRERSEDTIQSNLTHNKHIKSDQPLSYGLVVDTPTTCEGILDSTEIDNSIDDERTEEEELIDQVDVITLRSPQVSNKVSFAIPRGEIDKVNDVQNSNISYETPENSTPNNIIPFLFCHEEFNPYLHTKTLSAPVVEEKVEAIFPSYSSLEGDEAELHTKTNLKEHVICSCFSPSEKLKDFYKHICGKEICDKDIVFHTKEEGMEIRFYHKKEEINWVIESIDQSITKKGKIGLLGYLRNIPNDKTPQIPYPFSVGDTMYIPFRTKFANEAKSLNVEQIYVKYAKGYMKSIFSLIQKHGSQSKRKSYTIWVADIINNKVCLRLK